MKVLTGGIATASLIALALGACGNDGGSASFGGGAGPSSDTYCAQFTSCSACTPVSGCGWCYNSDGTGNCATGPDMCATSTSSFSWTWNPTGCRVTAEAGIGPGGDASAATRDGGSSAPGDALAEGAAISAADASSATPDAAGEAGSTEGGSDGAVAPGPEGGGGG